MPVSIDGYVIDLALREDHSQEAEVTEHAVETGSAVADHVRVKNATLTLDCLVSDTPIGDIANLRSATTLPSQECLDRLEAVFKAREPITVVTSIRTYPLMLMESFRIPRDKDTGDALGFTCAFRQLRLVTNNRVTVRVVDNRGKKKVNKGNKPAKPVTNEPPDTRSFAAKLFDRASGDRFRPTGN